MQPSEEKTWWQSIGDALRVVSAAMLMLLLAVIVADVYTYAYASHYLSLPIVIEHAQPTLPTVIVAVVAVLAINLIVEVIARFHDVAIVRRLLRSGTYVGLISFEKPILVVTFMLVAYGVMPVLAGQCAALTQTSFQVVQLNHARADVKEAIIVAPSVNGVLLALYDRARNVVLPGETVVDTLGPDEPRFSELEQLGRVMKR